MLAGMPCTAIWYTASSLQSMMYCSGALGACGWACATKQTPKAIQTNIHRMSAESILDHEKGSNVDMGEFSLQN